ncbi:molybdopterin molybdotransferase MoeA [Rubinisphaera margarita]|uniref:molybdopterin molybdotransferase MoeA n=1 Tax=Rubinisphaera margarita TaxID=2909586 RepID=UPI001EE98123|nr:gephyrin-like molybdotransferase Glp [Rubinisphaera margarita]MCG6157611.1 molybdopterin molybdotransferase MoeA [Rubinisphaera margarita]
MHTVVEALQAIDRTIKPGIPREVPVFQSAGSRAAEPIEACSDSPPFDKALMDGFAVRSQDIQPNVTLRVQERLTAGQVPKLPLSPGVTTQVMTGTQVPDGTDAVVRVEDVNDPEAEELTLSISSLAAGRNVFHRGESMQTGETILKPGELLEFPKIALLAELGVMSVSCFPRPTVSVLATGDELVPANQQPGPGQIRNSNEPMLVAQVANAGGIPQPVGIARDTEEDLREKIATGLESDFLLLSGGVSAGVLDLVPKMLAELGVQQVFHKVQMKPGKPIWFGLRSANPDEGTNACYVFGLPGNPVSSMVCFELFVRRAMARFQKVGGMDLEPLQARLTQPHLVKGDRPVYHPARVSIAGSEVTARPVRWVGSADLRGAAEANGMIAFPPRSDSYEADEFVDAWCWFQR